MSEADKVDIPDSLLQCLGINDTRFLQQVYAGGLDKYKKHLDRISFTKRKKILDAGCGFGQWTFAMAQTSKQVIGIDSDSGRLSVSAQLASINDVKNVEFCQANLEDMPDFHETFDAVFCYSVVYLTDYYQVFRNFFRSLRKGGDLYLCTNGPGWYLYNIIEAPNPSIDFHPRRYGLQTLWNTLIRKQSGFSLNTGARIMTPSGTKRALEKTGFEVVGLGAEGTLAIGDKQTSQSSPNYDATYMGLVNVFEVIARKP